MDTATFAGPTQSHRRMSGVGHKQVNVVATFTSKYTGGALSPTADRR